MSVAALSSECVIDSGGPVKLFFGQVTQTAVGAGSSLVQTFTLPVSGKFRGVMATVAQVTLSRNVSGILIRQTDSTILNSGDIISAVSIECQNNHSVAINITINVVVVLQVDQ